MSGVMMDARGSASFWHRLRHTRLRDALRGKIDGRLDLRRAVRAANLPPELATLVDQTARRTRLWRIEKVEVARELSAHFADGLDSGAEPRALAARFGDPRPVARLIRRAKRRGRPIAWRAFALFTRSIAALVGLLIVLYFGLAIRVHVGTQRISRNYVAELNAPVLAMPEEQRAWPLYRAALLDIDDVPRHDHLHMRDENWPELAAFAKRYAHVIPLLHEAAQRPHLGRLHWAGEDDPDTPDAHGNLRNTSVAGERTSDPEVSFLELTVPELRPLRRAAQLLLIDAQLAAQAGDAARVCRDLESALRVAEHVSETPMLIADLVAIGILSQYGQAIGSLLHEHAGLFSDEQLVRISHGVAGFHGGGRLCVRFDAERWTFEDLIQRLYTDDGAGNGHLTADAPTLLASMTGGTGGVEANVFPGRLFAPALSLLLVDRREMLRQHDRLMSAYEAEARLPLWERGASTGDREVLALFETSYEKYRYLPLGVLMPSLSRASVLAELATLRRDATLAVVACEVYRRREGRWPTSLAELTPRYLPSVPIDRFDGKPLRYRLVDGRPLLYSIGGDFDDDGGVVPATEQARREIRNWRTENLPEFRERTVTSERADGDWVFWPPVDW